MKQSSISAQLPAPRRPRHPRSSENEHGPRKEYRSGAPAARLNQVGASASAWLRRASTGMVNRLQPVGGIASSWMRSVRLRRAARSAVPLLALLPLLAVAGVFHYVYFDRSGLPDLGPFLRFEPPTIGEVFDDQGKVLIQLAREYRRVVSYEDVPPILRQAILAAED